MMNLQQATAAINSIPLTKESIPELMKLANGSNPSIPGYMALGRLQQIQKLVQDLSAGQPPQGTVKDNIERSVATMAMMGGRQQQAQQQQQMPPGGIASLPVPPNNPEPKMQEQAPEEEPAQQAASGGIMNAHVDPHMFNFDGGGIVAFAGGNKVTDEEKEKLRRQTAAYIEGLQQKAQEQQEAAAVDDRTPRTAANYDVNPVTPDDTVNMGNPPARVNPINAALTGIGRLLGGRTPQSMMLDSSEAPVASAPVKQPQRPVSITPPSVAAGPMDTPQVKPPAPPAAGPLAKPPAPPAAGPLAKPPAPFAVPGISDDDVAALAKKLTPQNPDAAKAEAARTAMMPEDFNQNKAIADQLKLNEALGIGTYSKNRREQLDKLKGEFEKTMPTKSDYLHQAMQAFARPGARAGDSGAAIADMNTQERNARFAFAQAQDKEQAALEAADEAVRTGNANTIIAAKNAAIKAKQDAQVKAAELAQMQSDNTQRAKAAGITAAVQLTDARNRDATMLKVAQENNISQEKVAQIHAAAQKYAADKPDVGERIFKKYVDIKNQKGQKEADEFLNDQSKVREIAIGFKYTGTNKDVEHETAIQNAIQKRTSLIDTKLQSPNLKPEERKKLLEQRGLIEKEVRSGYSSSSNIIDPFQ